MLKRLRLWRLRRKRKRLADKIQGAIYDADMARALTDLVGATVSTANTLHLMDMREKLVRLDARIRDLEGR